MLVFQVKSSSGMLVMPQLSCRVRLSGAVSNLVTQVLLLSYCSNPVDTFLYGLYDMLVLILFSHMF